MALVDAVVAGASQQRPAPAGFAICRPPGARPRARPLTLQAAAAQARACSDRRALVAGRLLAAQRGPPGAATHTALNAVSCARTGSARPVTACIAARHAQQGCMRGGPRAGS